MRIAAALLLAPALTAWATPRTYYVDCGSASSAGDGTLQAPLRSLDAVNALALVAGDSVLFQRGSVCLGALYPQGSGTEAAPIRIAAYGEGALPRIVAAPHDAAALRLTHQEFWEIQSLDLSGGTTYGVLMETDSGTMHHLVLRDLRVHDVRGPLQRKESGLVVIHASGVRGRFDDVDIDGVQAFDTTLWSGIFVSDAAHVWIHNAVVHDVQGDGIVVFRSHDAVISRSVAWHTGMQHQQTIGTPNAIWTWRCTDCMVQDNEAFLADSPGIDGGAFDIDYGNTRNTVQRNFGHDTAGYCVSVFAAFGPTTDSIVVGNLCLNNGMSPHLAQRQGAILLMSWQGGSLDGVDIRYNQIDWRPPGDTPAIQRGSELHASRVRLQTNVVWSTGISFVAPELPYQGDRNRYFVESPADVHEAMQRLSLLPEKNSVVEDATGHDPLDRLPLSGAWQLVAELTSQPDDMELNRSTLVALHSAALQYGHAGLTVRLQCAAPVAALAQDEGLPQDGVVIQPSSEPKGGFSVKLIAPGGAVARVWTDYPNPVELGLALRQTVGPPNFSFLPLLQVRATD